MPVVLWIIAAGMAMSALALVGSAALLIPERLFARVAMPLVALAAGALLGGALFHMLPEGITDAGIRPAFTWCAAGIVTFHVLEQFLNWHHCHRPVSGHRPLGYLILLADGLHNLIGGLAVGSAFIADIRLGIVTWVVAAAHEIPQELGDFGILLHSGWSASRALMYNFASALTFLLGALLAYLVAGHVDTGFLIPFAAGNFIYIALADLVPEMVASPRVTDKVVFFATFVAGLLILDAITSWDALAR